VFEIGKKINNLLRKKIPNLKKNKYFDKLLKKKRKN